MKIVVAVDLSLRTYFAFGSRAAWLSDHEAVGLRPLHLLPWVIPWHMLRTQASVRRLATAASRAAVQNALVQHLNVWCDTACGFAFNYALVSTFLLSHVHARTHFFKICKPQATMVCNKFKHS